MKEFYNIYFLNFCKKKRNVVVATNSKRQILFISFQAVEDPIFCVFDCTDDTDNISSILIFIAISI